MSMNIHLACGGTGGHIFPGLATGEVLRRRGHRVTLWMAGKDVEQTAVSGWDGPVVTVPSEGFSSFYPWKATGTLWRMGRAVLSCMGRMRQDCPDALLAMGSYASVGPVLAAFRLRVPVVLHEANVIPGRAIGLLSRGAVSVAAVFEESRFYLKGRPVAVTGMPLRREVVEGAMEDRMERPSAAPFTVLVMGGSRGARRLNKVIGEAVALLNGTASGLRFVHLTGHSDESDVAEAYRRAGVEHEVHAFCADMARLYRGADLAVCRSGAATCAELLVHRLPALLVPYPFAARRHQHANAQAMSRYGVADLVDERDLEAGWLAEYLVGMRRASDRRQRMSAAAVSHARSDAAEALADLVEKAARRE
jgi:UDP-N-acetylglucosamine--N-acetylmuramyl-(pentapeptide) pyrophosphoryl-undecaprenol N-acetylglucosamine transferase